MDNKNYLKSYSAAMHLAIIKKQWGIPAGRFSFLAALSQLPEKSAGYLILKERMLKII
jgi:hypothetical protein